MDISTITSLISTVGFPIVCVIALGWYVYHTNKAAEERNAKQIESMTKRCQEREDKLYEALKECREINAKAIAAIATYNEKLGAIQQDVSEIKTDITALMSK